MEGLAVAISITIKFILKLIVINLSTKACGAIRQQWGCSYPMKKPPRPLTAREVFSRNLRRARRLREMSQEQLALEAGLTRAYLSGVELAKRNISIDNLGLLADAVGVPLRDLVDPEKFKGLDDV